MKCSICDCDFWPGDTSETCPECLRVMVVNAVPDEDESDEPEDEDLVTKDYVEFYRAGMGKLAFRVHVGGDWVKYAKDYMERTEYWPDVWLEEERGGYTKITMEGP